MRSGDWSSDVCSSDLGDIARLCRRDGLWADYPCPLAMAVDCDAGTRHPERLDRRIADRQCGDAWLAADDALCLHGLRLSSEERRVGQTCSSTCKSRCWPDHLKTKIRI